MRKNVLCVFLSDLSQPRKPDPNHYYCGRKEKKCTRKVEGTMCPENCPDFYTGIQTNEACAKNLIRFLAKSGEGLDQIIAVCSDQVRTSLWEILKSKSPKEKDFYEKIVVFYTEKMKEMKNDCNFAEVSAIKYYKEVLLHFINNEGNDVSKHYKGLKDEQFFRILRITNQPDEKETYAVWSQLIAMIEPDTNLYIDLNGGFRDAAFILMALARIMQQKNVIVKGNYHINYNRDNNKQEPMWIQDKSYLFRSFDLVSGVDEFLKYGSVTLLSDFFEESNNTQSNQTNESKLVQKFKDSMEKVSESLQVCCPSGVWEGIEKLQAAMKETELYLSEKHEGSKEAVFFQLLDKVKEEYGSLLLEKKDENGRLLKDYLGLIEWCINKNMIQQAITFYETMVPEFLVDEKLLYWDESTQFGIDVKYALETKEVYRFEADGNSYTFINIVFGRNDYDSRIKFYKTIGNTKLNKHSILDTIDGRYIKSKLTKENQKN